MLNNAELNFLQLYLGPFNFKNNIRKAKPKYKRFK